MCALIVAGCYGVCVNLFVLCFCCGCYCFLLVSLCVWVVWLLIAFEQFVWVGLQRLDLFYI